MKLLLIRHAIAEDADAFSKAGGTDADRPLTETGRKRMRKSANRLRSQVIAIDLLACSPLLRARETAAILASAFGGVAVQALAELTPDSPPAALLAWLNQQVTAETIAVVGHAPHLSLVAGLLLANAARPLLAFKKGGVALIEFDTTVEGGAGVLRWALTPAQLRSLKD